MHRLPILLSSIPGSKLQVKFLAHGIELMPVIPSLFDFNNLSPYGCLSI